MFEALGINLPGLLTQLVSFLLIFWLLAKFGYPRIVKMLDERARRIQESLDAAEKAKQQAASAAEQVEKEIANARIEGQKLIAEAREAAARFRDDQQERARREADETIVRARADIARERDAAIEQVRGEFAGLAITAAERVISKSLDARAHRDLIEGVLREGLRDQQN